MKEINAFVGHSFTSTDEAVVSAFLNYFTQISKILPRFQWQHAQQAEPKIVTEKVRELFAGKNLFIGICTKKEPIINLDKVKKSFFWGKSVFFPDSLEWKTSDWVIQEIGYALGRNMDIVLLLEDGVRRPGELQGNLEYISFDRKFPEKAFGRLLEMLQAMSPGLINNQRVADEVQKIEEMSSEEDVKTDDDQYVPTKESTRDQFETAVILNSLLSGKLSIDQISSIYLDTDDAKLEKQLISWQAFCEYAKICYSSGGSLSNLEGISSGKDSVEALRYLARAYVHFEKYEEAGKKFEEIGDIQGCDGQGVDDYCSAADAYAQAGNIKYITILRKIAQKCSNNESLLKVYKALAEIMKREKNEVLEIAIKEKIVDIDPTDNSTRFSLAYKYSEDDRTKISLFHYLKISRLDRSDVTWNNIGVAYDKLDLNYKSRISYLKSVELKSTLAMANVAFKLIEIGMIDEAEEICKSAMDLPDYHKNIVSVLDRIKSIPDSEQKIVDSLLDKMRPLSGFQSHFGEAVLSESEVSAIHGKKYKGGVGEYVIDVSGGRFRATARYEVKNALSALVSGTTGATRVASFVGNANGLSVWGTLRDVPEESSSSVLGALNSDSIKVFLVISADFERINVCEYKDDSDYKLYELHLLK